MSPICLETGCKTHGVSLHTGAFRYGRTCFQMDHPECAAGGIKISGNGWKRGYYDRSDDFGSIDARTFTTIIDLFMYEATEKESERNRSDFCFIRSRHYWVRIWCFGLKRAGQGVILGRTLSDFCDQNSVNIRN